MPCILCNAFYGLQANAGYQNKFGGEAWLHQLLDLPFSVLHWLKLGPGASANSFF